MRLIYADDRGLTFDCSDHVRKSGMLIIPKKFNRLLVSFLKKHNLTDVGMSGNNDLGELIIKLDEEIEEEQSEAIVDDWKW